MLFGVRWGSLHTKIIAWSFVPTTIILVAVALVNFVAYQRVTEALVIERDQELTRLSASQLATELSKYTEELSALARVIGTYGDAPTVHNRLLDQARNRLVVFDGGAVVLDTFGRVTAAEPERPGLVGEDWSDRLYFRQMIRQQGPIFSNIVADGPDGAEVIVVAVPIIGNRGEFIGTLAGMFRLGARTISAFYGGIIKLRLGEGGNTLLVDGSGRVIYHTNTDLIGEDFSGQPLVQAVLAGQTGARRTEGLEQHAIVAGYAPVPGTSWGLVTEESWTMLIRRSQGYQWSLLLLLLLTLGVVLPAVVVTLGVRRLILPVEQLIAAAQEVAAGKFGQKISARTGDEIEELAEQFNLMSAQLQESYNMLEQRVADRTKELAILNAIGATVNESLDLYDTLNRALDETLGLLNLEVGEIRLLDEESGELVIRTQRGLSAEFVRDADRKDVKTVLPQASLETGEPVTVPDTFTAQGYELARREGLRALAIFPLRAKERLLGTLCLATRRGPRIFTRSERELLRAVSDQISVAIENAQLYGRAQQLAVLEERQRLARDLHDSVTQSLYGLTMYAEAATRLLNSGNIDMAADYLRELRATSQEALREMRLLIFELRPSILEEEGLVAALQYRLESVEKRSGLETSLEVEGEDGQLSPDVEEELYRIAQEALNNALKHAQANQVMISLYQRSNSVLLEISDNGQGFDPATVHERGGFGLRSMKERVSQMDGRLEIESQPGAGTRVRVEVKHDQMKN